MIRFFFVLMTALSTLSLVRADTPRVYRLWIKAEIFDASAIHAGKYTKKRTKYLRYFDMTALPPKDRGKGIQALGYVINSLSRSDEITPALEVPGTEGAVAFVTLDSYLIDPAVFDRLGELGSGPAPFPEPFYHLTVDTTIEGKDSSEPYKVHVQVRDGYGRTYFREETRYKITRSKPFVQRKVLIGAHINKGTALGLTALTETAFPVYEFFWFVANALVEPRYHELLGMDDSVESAQKLAGVDLVQANKVGAQVRGAVLFSEVAHRNRVLERTPTLARYGRGTFQSSFDFKTSVRVQDALKDLLISQADANEIIFTLPNGLNGFFIADANGKRLDKADADVALNNRSRFLDRQVRTAIHCIACHLPDKGWIEVDDEVRALATKPVKLLADSFAKDDFRRGEQIRQKYLAVDFNELLRADQAVVEVAVRAATTNPNGKSLTCAETAKIVTEVARSYTDDPVPLSRLAIELGVPQADLLKALTTEGLDPVFAVLAAGRKARRDQIESAFAQIAAVTYRGHK